MYYFRVPNRALSSTIFETRFGNSDLLLLIALLTSHHNLLYGAFIVCRSGLAKSTRYDSAAFANTQRMPILTL